MRLCHTDRRKTARRTGAKLGSTGTSRVAGLEAEDATADEVGPLDDLGEVGLAVVGVEGRGVEERAEWVATLVSTVGIFLATLIISGQVQGGLIYVASDFDVIRGLDPVQIRGEL